MDGTATEWVVVEQQHGLFGCLGVGEGDETVALQQMRRNEQQAGNKDNLSTSRITRIHSCVGAL
jgi:hypothetical protein